MLTQSKLGFNHSNAISRYFLTRIYTPADVTPLVTTPPLIQSISTTLDYPYILKIYIRFEEHDGFDVLAGIRTQSKSVILSNRTIHHFSLSAGEITVNINYISINNIAPNKPLIF